MLSFAGQTVASVMGSWQESVAVMKGESQNIMMSNLNAQCNWPTWQRAAVENGTRSSSSNVARRMIQPLAELRTAGWRQAGSSEFRDAQVLGVNETVIRRSSVSQWAPNSAVNHRVVRTTLARAYIARALSCL